MTKDPPELRELWPPRRTQVQGLSRVHAPKDGRQYRGLPRLIRPEKEDLIRVGWSICGRHRGRAGSCSWTRRGPGERFGGGGWGSRGRGGDLMVSQRLQYINHTEREERISSYPPTSAGISSEDIEGGSGVCHGGERDARSHGLKNAHPKRRRAASGQLPGKMSRMIDGMPPA
jgi:hypothetical protein